MIFEYRTSKRSKITRTYNHIYIILYMCVCVKRSGPFQVI